MVYLSDMGQQRIKQFQIVNNNSLLFKKQTDCVVSYDNIEYDLETKSIIGAGLLRIVDYLNYVDECKKLGLVVEKRDEYWCAVG